MTRLVVATVIGLMLGAGTARAQGTESPLFLDGSVFLGMEYRSRSQLSGSLTNASGEDPSDYVPGGGFAIGTFFGSRASARVEVALLGETTLRTESQIGSIETSIVDRSISGQSYSVLAGYHPEASGRLRFAYLAGVAFVRRREEFTQELRRDGFPPFVQPTVETLQGKQVVYGPTAMVGMDATVRLASHVDLVPQIRVTSASGLSVRPGVSVRWRR